MLPPWPGWDGLHPLIIHFPIALFIVAPVLMVLAITVRKYASGFGFSAAVLLILGTVAAFVAVSSGRAAAELADRSEAVNAVLLQHEEAAERTRDIFAAATFLYLGVLAASLAVKRPIARRFCVAGQLLALAVVLAGTLELAAAAHQGGVLVHRLGVHALMAPAPATVP